MKNAWILIQNFRTIIEYVTNQIYQKGNKTQDFWKYVNCVLISLFTLWYWIVFRAL